MKSTSRDANDGKRFAAGKNDAAAAAARSSETAYDDLVGTSSDSLLDMAVRSVVRDLDARAGNRSEDADGVDDVVREPPPPPTLGTHERIASLPPDLAQVVFDAVVATKRLGAGGVPLARQFKYLWVVDLAACGDVAEDDVVETLLVANARTLLRLSVARCVLLSPASLHGFERRHAFPALTHLDLSECATVTDETLACVARAPNLITLKAEGCAEILGGGLRHVAKLEKLKHLSLERCGRLGGERVSFDGGTPPLVSGPETVNATRVSANVEGLADAALRAAKKRRTGETGDEDAGENLKEVVGVPALAALASLETLNLGWCNRVSDDDIAALGGLKALKKLVLARTRAGAKAAEAIRRLSDLEALDVTGAPFDDEALAILTAPKPGNQKDVSSSVESGALKEASPLPKLHTLSLEATPITGSAGERVANAFASSLVLLNAAFTEMSDDGVRALERLSRLRAVNLDSCPVSDAAAKALSRLPELESVTLADTDVGNDGVDALASRLTRLAHLDLGHTLVDDDGVERLRFCKNTLRSLSLDSRLISDRGVKRIADLHELESLDLFAADVTDACAEAFRHMTKLKSLEACGGRLTDVFVARVARHCPNLETLNLGQNAGVTDVGAECVAASLTKLTALNLCGSKVTDAGAKRFARLRNLSTLALKECRGVTSASATFLRETCPKLTEVTFGDARSETRVANENIVANAHPGPGPGPVAITAPIVVEDGLDVASELAAEAAEDASEMEDDFQTESSESESDADPPTGDA